MTSSPNPAYQTAEWESYWEDGENDEYQLVVVKVKIPEARWGRTRFETEEDAKEQVNKIQPFLINESK